MPKPGPFGSSVNEVGFPLGSLAKRPLRGPGGDGRSALQSAKIAAISLVFKSS